MHRVCTFYRHPFLSILRKQKNDGNRFVERLAIIPTFMLIVKVNRREMTGINVFLPIAARWLLSGPGPDGG